MSAKISAITYIEQREQKSKMMIDYFENKSHCSEETIILENNGEDAAERMEEYIC